MFQALVNSAAEDLRDRRTDTNQMDEVKATAIVSAMRLAKRSP